MKHAILAAALISPLMLSGCVISIGDDGVDGHYGIDWEDREHNNRKHIGKLELGASYEKVTRGDGVTTKDECTPLVFVDGVLTGWGDSALDSL